MALTNNPADWVTYVNADGTCYLPSDCTQLDDYATRPKPSKTITFCRKDGVLVPDGEIENNPDTSKLTGTLTTKQSESGSWYENMRQGCPISIRDMNICGGQVLGWNVFQDLELTQKQVTTAQNVFGENGGTERRVTYTFEYTDVVCVDLSNGKTRSFATDAALSTVALFQCGDGSCGGSSKKCGVCASNAVKHSACDHIILVETDGTDTYISHSYDGGASYVTTDTYVGVVAVDANCTYLYTTTGRAKWSEGGSYSLEALPENYDESASTISGGYGDVMIYDQNGVMVYDADSGSWSIVQVADPLAQVQTHVVANDCAILTFGNADGTNTGLVYYLSSDGGGNFAQYNLAFSGATATDEILDLDLLDNGLFVATVTDGATHVSVYYSEDGITWIRSVYCPITAAVDAANFVYSGGLARLHVGKEIFTNSFGLCEEYWDKQNPTKLANCPSAIATCPDNPANLAYVYPEA